MWSMLLPRWQMCAVFVSRDSPAPVRWSLPVCMELGGAQWIRCFPAYQLAYVQRDLGREVSQPRREEFNRIVFVQHGDVTGDSGRLLTSFLTSGQLGCERHEPGGHGNEMVGHFHSACRETLRGPARSHRTQAALIFRQAADDTLDSFNWRSDDSELFDDLVSSASEHIVGERRHKETP